MKLKFNPNLDYQNEAVDAVVNLFEGQNSMQSYFTVTGQVGLYDAGTGVGNRLDISNDTILENLRKVQIFHRLPVSDSLSSLDFNIEMETGTGKTYVYLKTIFELNKRYGFTKFIIVVPSIAIKEGVYKTLEITREHFKGLYDNVIYDYFVYDSSKLDQVRNFSVSSNIQIMIINIDAFNKSFTDPSKETKANIIHRENDRLSGYKPIDIIADTNPVVVIDEPQSVVGTSKSKIAIASLNPLFTLRYSATHKEIQNLIYKLDAVDAYEKNLVKQIEVASFKSENYHNKAYMKLESTDNIHSPITANIEIDANIKGKIKRKTFTVKKGDDLSSKNLGNREIYEGYIVDEIYCEEGNEFVSFTSKEEVLRKDLSVGNIDDKYVKRAQIRKTIEEHFEKQIQLKDKGIKVLSLFFIDKVANYRQYDADGNPIKGPYAKIFEEEYNKAIKQDKFSTLFNEIDRNIPVDEVHNGYFSIDKHGHFKDSKETKKGKLRSNKADEDTFNLIMKDKERLLSFDSNLAFIFSHSALKEGWDNPNVFQICTLNETTSTMKKRQEIGRGLRLCVNQFGERVTDRNINRLTIMANESYEEFARKLQTEMEESDGIKFGTIENTSFSSITRKDRHGEYKPIGKQGSMKIFNSLKKNKYINGKGKIQENLKADIRDNVVKLPEEFNDIKEQVIDVITQHTRKVEIKDANRKRKVKINKKVFLSDKFKKFWNEISQKTVFSVDYDSNELKNNCVKALKNELNVKPPKLIYTKSGLTIDASGVNYKNGTISSLDVKDEEIALPDIVTFLQNETD
ncbi:MAG: DEAD/DEAH box helicase family protein, partial [Methanosphaera sp.]